MEKELVSGLSFEPHVTAINLMRLMQTKSSERLIQIEQKFGSVHQLCKDLHSDENNGINDDPMEIQQRVLLFGSNLIAAKASKSLLKLVWEALHDKTLIILEVAAIISLCLSFFNPDTSENHATDDYKNDWIEGTAILCTVIVVVLISSLNDYTKERQFVALQKKIQENNSFNVLRNGKIVEIPVNDILVGDICLFKCGDRLPADGILLQSNDLKVDESSLTGESDCIKKSVCVDPMLFSGTYIIEGRGKMIVTAVGINSQAGIISSLLTIKEKGINHSESLCDNNSIKESIEKNSAKSLKTENMENNKSVLQNKLTKLSLQIGFFGSFVAFLTFIILLVIFTIKTFAINKEKFTIDYMKHLVKFLIVAVTVVVVAVPEGLPLATAVSLAYSVKKMMFDNNLVRHLDACETMGNSTTICTDKTGTLTTNRMTVVHIFVSDIFYESIPKYSVLAENVAYLLVCGICINSSYTNRIEFSKFECKQIGNKTECALLGLVLAMGKDYNEIRKNYPEQHFHKVYTFNSEKKSMSTVIPLENNNGFRVFTKGAPENILYKCEYKYNGEGHIQSLTQDEKLNIINTIIKRMTSHALRTICLAYKDFVRNQTKINETLIEDEPNWDQEECIIKDLTLIGIVGIEDPVRPEVPESILQCQRAGITVRMVTGDNVHTARSITFKCGIIKDGDDFLILEGEEFNEKIRDSCGQVDQQLFDRIYPRLRVLARASPKDKYILVKHIIESKINQEVVAVTGDGTNDGPALRRADVGFAMGIAGTDVAKEASNIIITDDNFRSIVKAVMWGRNVYDSILKFLQFQLTVNVVAVVVVFIGSCTNDESPLRAVQMLWVNLIMDTLASLALATDPPTTDLLARKPHPRNKSLVSRTMIKNIAGQAVYQITIIFILLYSGHKIFCIESGFYNNGPNQHFTLVFNTFVMMTLFNEINCRKIDGDLNVFKGILQNSLFCMVLIGTSITQVLIVQLGGTVFYTHPLTLIQWLCCILLGAGSLLFRIIISVFLHFNFRKTSSQSKIEYIQLV